MTQHEQASAERAPLNLKALLSEDEYAAITRRSDGRAAWIVLCQWLQVAAIFAVVGLWTNPLTLLLGTLLLGGRQLGFGILVHECGHRTLFQTQRLNDWVGDWLGAAPTFNNMRAYMRGHLVHHRLAGTEQDPDLSNYRDYPISRARLRRKLGRDLTGQTGWRTLKGIGRSIAKLPELSPEARAAVVRALVVNIGLLGVLTAFGAPWLYLVWIAAYVFVNPLVSRIRQVAEHAAVPDLLDPDPRMHTRSIRANYLWRAIFSPHDINYHLEHHLLASVPIYNLRPMHALLARRGAYAGLEFPSNHLDLLRQVTFDAPVARAA
ncbi:MAG TPA: fatty acid desaturase family protein [Pseudomonadales bacterium]|nr:fatty acid desaturase family protein [Pseudomonadales bacterium]